MIRERLNTIFTSKIFYVTFSILVSLTLWLFVEINENRTQRQTDRLESRTVPVNVMYSGGTADGFVQDTIKFSPQMITISGPANVVSLVKSARVTIDRENLSSTYIDDLPFVLLDERGYELSESLKRQINSIEERVQVVLPIRVSTEEK